MKFDIYGRFQIEIVPSHKGWRAFRIGNGTRVPFPDLVLPEGINEIDIGHFLDDHFHEYAQPGQTIRQIK